MTTRVVTPLDSRTVAFRTWLRAVLADAEGVHNNVPNERTPTRIEAPGRQTRSRDNGRGAA